jgi:hypothetical protein
MVTRQQIRSCFHEIDRRSQPGVYPGFGPRKLFELEMEALTTATDCPVLWAAASGANMSVNRAAFLDNGGFKPELDNNEHRELALRLLHASRSLMVALHALSAGSALKTLRTLGTACLCAPSIARTIRKAVGLQKARFSSQPRRGILLSASKSCLPNLDLARFRMTNSNVREMPT